jgi:predicted ribosome quality control (RQC) complex YloA/Tae2 family protein
MVKYSYKEKKSHFNALRNTDSASVDLELLLQLCPEHPDQRRFILYAKKLGDEILLSLLDFATKEEIREFRRKKSEPVPQPAPQPESPVEGDTVTDNSEQLIAEAEQRASEAEERADDAELRAEEAEEKVEEAELRAEEAEERAEQAEQALEEEKKKERPASAKSKRKKNSPK